jgi:hypothetical protein
MSDAYSQLMAEVTDTKDLGSGVIDGVECDHLAFRTEQADWQIWIAQGSRPIRAATPSPARRCRADRNTASMCIPGARERMS